jgi:hypothetical protein
MSSLTRDDIILAYRLFLGRNPSDAEADRMLANQSTLDGLRRVFLYSEEFRKKTDGTLQEKGRPTLIHLHIPKSAGSSLSQLLVHDTNPNERMTIGDGDLDRLRTLPEPRRRQLKLIFGHLSFGVARHLPQYAHYVTVLREPGPRILSFYRYVKRTDHHPLYPVTNETDMSFGQFLEFTAANPRFRLEVDNGQIRRLGGSMTLPTLGQEEELLRQALHNLMSPQLSFGLTEYFDEFLASLVKRGLLSAASDIRVNAAPDTVRLEDALSALTPAQRTIYDGYIAWDSLLYDICKRVFFSGQTTKEPS